jgi:predicted nucleic acid-binding protein
MTRAYIDTPAFLRGFLADAQQLQVVRELLADPLQLFVSSDLLWLEAGRTGIRLVTQDPRRAGLPEDIELALEGIEWVALDRSVLAAARAIPEIVKPLDAIHIATAEMLGDAIDYVLTYDATMTRVLRAHGVTVMTAAQAPAAR